MIVNAQMWQHVDLNISQRLVSLFNLGCTKRSPTAVFQLPLLYSLLYLLPKCQNYNNYVRHQSTFVIFLKRLDIVDREVCFFCFFLWFNIYIKKLKIKLLFKWFYLLDYLFDHPAFNLFFLSLKSTLLCSWTMLISQLLEKLISWLALRALCHNYHIEHYNYWMWKHCQKIGNFKSCSGTISGKLKAEKVDSVNLLFIWESRTCLSN